MKNKETLLLVVIVLIVGVLVGILVSKAGKGPGKPAQAPSAPPQAGSPATGLQQTIKMLEELVAKDPNNRNAWVELGHNYFDSDQPVKAIEAYDRALALGPNDPNVLTDQGVMFRRMGQYDRAVENFSKAAALDPSHLQSIYNLGIVYRHDLKDFPKAREAWSKFLALNPTGPAAEQVRAEMQMMEQVLGTGTGPAATGK
jgi:cytochrome c-type biogenesis protein CcmH/NrfG